MDKEATSQQQASGLKLYELDWIISSVINQGFVFDEETGEILFDADSLEALEAAREAKLEGCAIVIKNLEAEVAAFKAEEKALAERRQVKERAAESMRRYLANSMLAAGEAKLETTRCAVSFRKSESVEVFDAEKLPADLCTVKQTVSPDKAAIKKLLKAGEAVEGAQLIVKQNIQVK